MIDLMTSASSETHRHADRIGAARLVRMAYEGRDLAALREDLRLHVGEPGAAMDLSVIEQVLGNRDLGLRIQHEALKRQQCFRPVGSAAQPRLRVLALAAPLDIGGNTPIDFLIADPEIELKVLYVIPGQPIEDRIPDHDIAVVIIPDEEEAAASLDQIRPLMAAWPCPVLNPPDKIAQVDRHRLFPIIQSIPGLFIPPTIRMGRDDLAALGQGGPCPAGLAFPMIARPVGSHAGRGLERLTTAGEIAAYLDQIPNAEFFASRFIDYRGDDGLFRKYRIVFVDGKPYACHMAMTEHWAVWYLNADMYASAEKREEEARFMGDFDIGFGLRHKAALDAIAARLGLDYVIIDCAETHEGELLVFEAGTAMIVHDMDSEDLFPYKKPQMRKIFAAYTAMLERHVAARRGA